MQPNPPDQEEALLDPQHPPVRYEDVDPIPLTTAITCCCRAA